MDPTKSSKVEILSFISNKGQTTAKEIRTALNISQVTLFKHLKTLLADGEILKVGTVPKVYYSINSNSITSGYNTEHSQKSWSIKSEKLFDAKFVNISPEGLINYGFQGFKIWCQKQNLDVEKTANEYIATWHKYNKFYTLKKDYAYIDASFKLSETYSSNFSLDKMLYLDFYAIERFGKTKLAWLTFQSKQSQDPKLIDLIISQTKEQIKSIIKDFKIQAVGFIPPTVKRRVQFMEIFEQKLQIDLPRIKIKKIIYDTPVQQKSLKDKNDRLENATKTFYIPDQVKYKKVLLIDDFVGSGATLNQIAFKIKENQIAKNVIGLAITGSFKGFEVVNQV